MMMRGICVFVFAVALGAGCAVEAGPEPAEPAEPAESAEVQELSAGCTLLRPVGWNGANAYCIERSAPHLEMTHGEIYTTWPLYVWSGSGWTGGWGTYRVQCNNGQLQELTTECYGGIEP